MSMPVYDEHPSNYLFLPKLYPRRHDLQEQRLSVNMLLGDMADALLIRTAKLSSYESGKELIPPVIEARFLALKNANLFLCAIPPVPRKLSRHFKYGAFKK